MESSPASEIEERIEAAIKATEADWARFRAYPCLRCKSKNWGSIQHKKFINSVYMEATCQGCGFVQRVPIESKRLGVEGKP